MRIRNALVFTEDQRFEKRDVFTAGGKILTQKEWETLRCKAGIDCGSGHVSDAADDNFSAGRAGTSAGDFGELDAEGMLLLPGLVDIHSHGAVGRDFSDGDIKGLKEILAYEYAHGVTSYCPTSMPLPEETLPASQASTWKDLFSIRSKKAPTGKTASGCRILNFSTDAMKSATAESV